MEETGVKRKLAAILAADVEGYSCLMGADEEATLKTLGAYREIIDSLIARHEGRVVGATARFHPKPGGMRKRDLAPANNTKEGSIMKKLLRLARPDVAAARGDVLFQDRERIGGSPMMPLQSAVVGLCLAVFAVTGTSALSAEPQDVSPQDADLVFNADELGMKLKVMKSWTDSGDIADNEIGYWTASNEPVPFLLLRLQSLHSFSCFVGPGAESIRDIIAQNKLFQKEGVEWGKKSSIDNVSGTAEYETFRSGDLHCFVIREYSGSCDEPGMDYDKLVVGHYCAITPTGNSEDTIRAVLSRIGIKGEGIPTKE